MREKEGRKIREKLPEAGLLEELLGEFFLSSLAGVPSVV
jgi:hypothetical protein